MIDVFDGAISGNARLAGLTWAEFPRYSSLYRVVAGSVQGLLAMSVEEMSMEQMLDDDIEKMVRDAIEAWLADDYRKLALDWLDDLIVTANAVAKLRLLSREQLKQLRRDLKQP
jgi:hypothetical protein